ncbi:unnamed protein product, partial [Allacma fusca]
KILYLHQTSSDTIAYLCLGFREATLIFVLFPSHSNINSSKWFEAVLQIVDPIAATDTIGLITKFPRSDIVTL